MGLSGKDLFYLLQIHYLCLICNLKYLDDKKIISQTHLFNAVTVRRTVEF